MKRKVYLLLFWTWPILADAQYASYPLVEWFTNTYCGICSSRNPALRTVYNKYSSQAHRITIHPSVPYPQCPLYNFNKEANGARQSYYGVPATPTMYINGVRSSSTAAVFEDDLKKLVDKTAPVVVEVEEALGASRKVEIKIRVGGNVPQGNYRLYVALLEENVDLDAENGETEHLDVLRSFISAATGDNITLPAVGATLERSYDVTIPSGVKAESAYVLAYIQEHTSRIILNSGTRFDEVSTSISDVAAEVGLRIFPNPAGDFLQVSVDPGYQWSSFEIYNTAGQRLKSIPHPVVETQTRIGIEELPGGHYLLQVNLGAKVAVVPFVKE